MPNEEKQTPTTQRPRYPSEGGTYAWAPDGEHELLEPTTRRTTKAERAALIAEQKAAEEKAAASAAPRSKRGVRNAASQSDAT